MAMVASNMGVHLPSQLTRSLERILEEAHLSGELKLTGRKLKDFPNSRGKYDLSDTVIADLSKNRFGELPVEITEFCSLERLLLYHNAIRTIPDTVVYLQSLVYLDLSRNQLSVLPSSLCQLPLEVLLVSNNKLMSLPEEVGRIKTLAELDASCNEITHLPRQIGDLLALRFLNLRRNMLSDLPIEVTELSLEKLDISSNRISRLPVELKNMTTLVELLLSNNPMTSPPSYLCTRGRVHIFKFLEIQALKEDKKKGLINEEIRRMHRKVSHLSDSRVTNGITTDGRQKRYTTDSGYSTSEDKRWSQEIRGLEDVGKMKGMWLRPEGVAIPVHPPDPNGSCSGTSTPSTISPGDYPNLEDELTKAIMESRQLDRDDSGRASCTKEGMKTANGREYKEALRQQRSQDVYRPRLPATSENPMDGLRQQNNFNQEDERSCTIPQTRVDVQKSSRQILEESINKRPVQKVPPSRNGSAVQFQDLSNLQTQALMNGSKGLDSSSGCYIKPSSPIKTPTTLAHVPGSSSLSIAPGSPKLVTATVGYVGTLPVSSNGTRGQSVAVPRSPKVGPTRGIPWNREVPPEKLTFTMRREFDKAREEAELTEQLRNCIETRLKMALPDDMSAALADGVVLCHLANHVRPRSVASIHVPSPAVPKLTMARCRRNVDNFLEACRRIGVDEALICCAADVLEGRGTVQVAITVTELLKFHQPRSPTHVSSLSS